MTELPTENELIDGEWYLIDNIRAAQWAGDEGRFFYSPYDRTSIGVGGTTRLQRLAPVAVYRPEPAEPTGLGAVILDGKGRIGIATPDVFGSGVKFHFVSIDKGMSHYEWLSWAELPRPITIFSEGWTE